MMSATPVAANAFLSTSAQASVAVGTRIIVGPGGDFGNVADAINSITDNSESKPYLILVMPGIYSANWSTKEWVSVQGSGPLATIFQGSNWGGIKIAQPNVSLSNFGIRFTSTTQDHSAIRRTGLTSSINLSDIHIEVSGPGAAIANRGGATHQTWWLRDIKIRSEGIGLDLAGHTYCDNLKIFLFGVSSGHPHVGCRVTGNSVRIYLNNCRLGTGYGWEYKGGWVPNDVSGDDDLIGIWIPAGYSAARVEIHGLESFCRNDSVSNPSVNVNVIRAETGWVRAFGCFGQAESWVGKTLFQSGEGMIEQYACRFSGIQGDSFGSDTIGVQTFTYLDDGYQFQKFECGLHLLDATSGAFTLILEPPAYAVPGEVHIFKKVDGLNPVTVGLGGATLEGDSNDYVLSQEHEGLKIVWSGAEWVKI